MYLICIDFICQEVAVVVLDVGPGMRDTLQAACDGLAIFIQSRVRHEACRDGQWCIS